MGWFSPIKGSYPSLAQVDKTLPVKKGVDTVTRGTIVALKEDPSSREGVWNVASGTDELLYVALADFSDPASGFAGSAFNPDGGVPRITAISLSMDGEYETTEFDATKTYKAGEPLYAEGGKLTNVKGTATTVAGYVTMPAATRWINDAIAVPADCKDPRLAIRTGANKPVLRFRTAK